MHTCASVDVRTVGKCPYVCMYDTFWNKKRRTQLRPATVDGFVVCEETWNESVTISCLDLYLLTLLTPGVCGYLSGLHTPTNVNPGPRVQ